MLGHRRFVNHDSFKFVFESLDNFFLIAQEKKRRCFSDFFILYVHENVYCVHSLELPH